MDLGMRTDINMVNARWSSRLLPAALLGIGAFVFCTGITWGLPSRDVNPFLFGSEPVWSGEKIQRLAGERPIDPTRGADVAVDPVVAVGQSVPLNDTDRKRAEIIRRYRLYTYHPDEMVTMMSLATMRPGRGDFDPRLYQYGGLWIYPVGLLLRVAAACGALTLTGDIAYYLDRPEEFGRFYIVARLYVVAWALTGVWVVYHLVRRLSGGCRLTAALATLCFMLMPVVVTSTHEAKPHLPGVVLTLLAIMAAVRYVDGGGRRWGLVAAVLAGAAFGMVLNAWPALLIPPTMIFLRKHPPQERMGMSSLACAAGWRSRPSHERMGMSLRAGAAVLATYFVTNPYVLINLFRNRALLRSNLDNTRAMFTIGPFTEALGNGFLLMVEGVSPVLFGACVCGLAVFVLRVLKRAFSVGGGAPLRGGAVGSSDGQTGLLFLLLIPALGNLVQFLLFAWNQNAAYGRFALLANTVLGITALAVLGRMIPQTGRRTAVLSFLLATTAFGGYDYLRAFQNDTSGLTSRLATAWNIRQLEGRAASLGVFNDPAPYSVPPVNLFHWRLELLPEDIEDETAPVEVLTGMTRSVENNFAARANAYTVVGYYGPPGLRDMICWADQGMVCLIRAEPDVSTTREGDSDAP